MSLKQFQEKSLNCEGNVRIIFFLGIVTKSELCYAKLCIEMFTLIFLTHCFLQNNNNLFGKTLQ